MTRYKLLKSSISLEDFEDLLAFLVAGFDFDKNQAKPWSGATYLTHSLTKNMYHQTVKANFLLQEIAPKFSND